MRSLICLSLLVFTSSFSQTKYITGIVYDSLNIPLENANIIANPFEEKAQIKFAIADNKGRYRLELDNSVKYEIRVSYIGYRDDFIIVETNSTIAQHNFKLKNTGQILTEVVIKHNFKPIVIKKDTVTYDIKAFASGNERKMKEILDKLPGMEVDKKGQITFQGKKVTQMLVEGKSFFGGGSKLAVENIPADALDKIEMIDNFNEVSFMKEVSDSEDLAMNVKLKKDKKQFIFGDLEAGIGSKSNHLAHVSLFYYSPKSNISFIGDDNTIGKSTFTFDDLMRFDGGVSTFLTNRKSFTNLYAFTNDNTDMVQNKSNFTATNFSIDISPKFSISGYTLFSKVFTEGQTVTQNYYLQNSTIDIENRLQNNTKKSILGIGNIKLGYLLNTTEKVLYNMQFQFSNNNDITNLVSATRLNSSVFETKAKSDNLSIKQFAEWHKSYNDHHTTTLVINQAYDANTPINTWITNQPFLSGLIPLQKDTNYTIQQIKKVNNNNIDLLFKHYWVLNSFNHLYTNIGNNYTQTSLLTTEQQLLSNGNVNDFAQKGFGNSINYKLNDTYLGFEYKFRIGKWTNKSGLYCHFYDLKTNQISGDYSLSKTLFQPQCNSEYEFNKSETLKFNYKLANSFPEADLLANQFTLQSYNSVFKGNALLENEQFHNANLSYSKMNLYRGIILNANASYAKKAQANRSQVVFSGINQYVTSSSTNNPETTWRVYGAITKKIYRFNLKLNSNLNWFNYTQSVNNLFTTNERNSQSTEISVRTAYKKWPDFNIQYTKNYNQTQGIANSKFQSDQFNVDFETTVLKNWIFKVAYENLKNTNNSNQSNYFNVASTSLRYQQKKCPFGFEFTANNFLNTTARNDYSFSDYLISEQSTYVLPRIFLFTISYKL